MNVVDTNTMLSPVAVNSPLLAVVAQHVDRLNERDILLGRGTGPNDHGGNQWFRNLVNSRRSEYLQAATSAQQRKVFETTIALVHSSGGRFLKKVGSVKQKKNKKHDLGGPPSRSSIYEIVRDAKVLMDKTKQAFRYSKERPSSSSEVSNGTASALLNSPSLLESVITNNEADNLTSPPQSLFLLQPQNLALSTIKKGTPTAPSIPLLDELTRRSAHQSAIAMAMTRLLPTLQHNEERKTRPGISPAAMEQGRTYGSNQQHQELLWNIKCSTPASRHGMFFQGGMNPLHQLAIAIQSATNLVASTAAEDYADEDGASNQHHHYHHYITPTSSYHGDSSTSTASSVESDVVSKREWEDRQNTVQEDSNDDTRSNLTNTTWISKKVSPPRGGIIKQNALVAGALRRHPTEKTAAYQEQRRVRVDCADDDAADAKKRKQRSVFEDDENFVKEFLSEVIRKKRRLAAS